MDLAMLLKNIMEKQDITQAELHKRSGISRSHISEILSGKRPSVTVDTILKLGNALNVNPSYFLGELELNVFPSYVSEEVITLIRDENNRLYLDLLKKMIESRIEPDKLSKMIDILG